MPGQQDCQVGGAEEHHWRKRIEHIGKQDVVQAGEHDVKLFCSSQWLNKLRQIFKGPILIFLFSHFQQLTVSSTYVRN